MMGIFSRVRSAIEADLNEVLDKKERENPIAMLNQYLRQSEQEVEKVRKLVERQHTLKEEFSRELKQAKEMADKRAYQAEIASKAGETELYEFTVYEQKQYEERANRIQEALNQASHHLLDLEKRHEDMKHKLKDMYIKRMELMGRENIARANHKMNQVMDTSSNNATKAQNNFEEMESYLDRLEQQVNTSYYRNTIDVKIAQLEKQMKTEESN
ncbi:PspA/IM30 family protein [Bacillus sp. HMF5848]|uniref:PspA/IM30 family protein n=1 Tax=Bacillus sp. HMF5848 TaxID=2495421 RepID=UPI000F7B0FAC|nr:PspA/IM30 family protein [Bacillus sp. HMF5848]RSK26003.1 PspA/IM30 family protein [Bacillus sp. HMF5848]